MLEKLGVKSYQPGGAAGTVFASDLANGDVSLAVVTSSGQHFSIQIADPLSGLTSANFSSADFLFA